MFDVQWEHPPLPLEAPLYSATHSAELAALHKPLNRFLWRPPTLWWVIKAYLHSVPMKWSEAPERRRVWTDISVPLHSLPCCHDSSFRIITKKNNKKNSTKQPRQHRSCITWMCTATSTTVSSVNVPRFICLWQLSSAGSTMRGRILQIKRGTESSLPAESPEIIFPVIRLF